MYSYFYSSLFYISFYTKPGDGNNKVTGADKRQARDINHNPSIIYEFTRSVVDFEECL